MDLLVLVSCLSIFLLCVAAVGSSVMRNRRLPPGPWGVPVFGSLYCVEKPLHRYFARLSTTYGPIVYLNMGSRPTAVVSSPELAELVLRECDIEFANRPMYSTVFRHLSYSYTDLVFSPHGVRWRYLRKICSTELFTSSKVSMFSRVRRVEMQSFATDIGMYSKEGRDINMSVKFQELLTNLMTTVLFGKKFYGQPDSCVMPEAEAYRATWGMLVRESGKLYVGDYVPALRWLDCLRGKDRKVRTTIIPALQALLHAVVTERQAQRAASKHGVAMDFLDVMLDLDRQEGLSTHGIMAIIQDMLLAGTGTTRATLEWGFSEIIRHPEVQRKAQEELDRVVGRERDVEESDLKSLVYTQAVVKEIMRLHPAAPLGLPHSNTKPVNISGYTLPTDSTIHVNIWAICRDPRYWEDPDEFKPERFIGKDYNLFGRHFEFIPFSAGRRRCAGIPLAAVHITLTLAYLLHRFHWGPPFGKQAADVDMLETTGLACVRTNHLCVSATPRM